MYRLLSGLLLSLLFSAVSVPASSSGSAVAPIEGFAVANGVRLQYLDWGHKGRALILVHGLGDNPHKFDDLAPAFTDRFHVIAYARRGDGGSEARGPYDVETLTEDLRSLMDALGIATADFVGQSAGGNEVTELAARYPQRVRRIVYLDAGYDWSDPDFRAACATVPFTAFNLPPEATSSWDAYVGYQKTIWYPQLDDMHRIEANLRENIVIQPDRSVKFRTEKDVMDAHFNALLSNKSKDYARVHSPVLAMYAEHMYDPRTGDPRLRDSARAWETQYWDPFQEKSMARVRNQLVGARIVRVPGAHGSFFLTYRSRVVEAMRQFLQAPQ